MRIFIKGAVQGVGFRPFIYTLANDLKLKGWVLNSPEGVQIEAEGPPSILEDFLIGIQEKKPKLAFIQSLEWTYLDPAGHTEFRIKKSKKRGKRLALILPDISTCDLCLKELTDIKDRRNQYPFINCTLCGPRYSIIEKLPYDRPNTSMKHFILCSDCAEEYENPNDRRFHAQPTACKVCGPHIELLDNNGLILAKERRALKSACNIVRKGKILALKGLGGFLLITNATENSPIKRLRERKLREEKPLALMYPDLNRVKDDCIIEPMEERLLTSPEKPIVLLRKSSNCTVSELVAPGNPFLGVMLPYTPLHHLLMNELNFPVIATSGNLTDEPMVITTDDALKKLGGIADAFLKHNRPIVHRMDDSIIRIMDDREVMLRRARGYAPLPIEIDNKLPRILALGAHLKNSIALSIDNQVFISQHIGDLETKEAIESFQMTIKDFQKLYDFKPEVIAVDLHPGYESTRYGEKMGYDTLGVQHHLAHVYSAIADNNLVEPILGISWDGTGYGEDNTIWGGEFIIPQSGRGEWVAGFEPFPLIGGEKAIKEPRRIALALLYKCFGTDAFDMVQLPTLKSFEPEELEWMRAALEQDLQSPRCRSVGRLFDGVSSLLNLRQKVSYEGQAAMALEFSAHVGKYKSYPYDIRRSGFPIYVIDWEGLLSSLVADMMAGVEAGRISMRFHRTLADIATEIALHVGIKKIVLSGGVFQNALLTRLCRQSLKNNGFEVYTHQRVPPNDGGISVGQIIATSEAIQ